MTEEKTYTVDQLEFREINSSADTALLKLLSEKELVHPDCADIIKKNRMAPDDESRCYDKHCYGLFAPGSDMPEAVIYVKLMSRKTDGNASVANDQLTGNIKPILNEEAKPCPSKPNAAFFYSITNLHTHRITRDATDPSVGDKLINAVAAHLNNKYQIHTFSTLSPMRSGIGKKAEGFAQWLKLQLEEKGSALFTKQEKDELDRIKSWIPTGTQTGYYDLIDYLHRNTNVLKSFDNAYTSHFETFSHMMKSLGLMYLVDAKNPESPMKVLNKVEHFHLSNGAMLANIQYRPAKEMTESENSGAFGLMANYRYEPEYLAERKETYASQGKITLDTALATRYDERCKLLNQTPRLAVNRPVALNGAITVQLSPGGIEGNRYIS